MNTTKAQWIRDSKGGGHSFDWSCLQATNNAAEVVRQAAAQKLTRQMAEIEARYDITREGGYVRCVRRGKSADWAVVTIWVVEDLAGPYVRSAAQVSAACPLPEKAFAELGRIRAEKALEVRAEKALAKTMEGAGSSNAGN